MTQETMPTLDETPTLETAPTKRTKAAILEEYKQVASLVGDKTYRCKLLEVELEELLKKLYMLNTEHLALATPTPSLVPAATPPTMDLT